MVVSSAGASIRIINEPCTDDAKQASRLGKKNLSSSEPPASRPLFLFFFDTAFSDEVRCSLYYRASEEGITS